MTKGLLVFALILGFAVMALGQRGTTFTGTAVIYGSGLSTRTVTRGFTLIINGKTSAAETSRLLGTLDRGGQDALLRDLDDKDLGRFALTGSVGLPINAVFVDREGDETRIRVVLKRWLGFGELRRGLRSTDYPFTYLELRVDRRGHGEGTIIPAAKVRFRGSDTIEVEDFGTFPGRLMGVRMRGTPLP